MNVLAPGDTGSIFLSAADLRYLTGYAQRKKQVAELRRLTIPFRVNAAGNPIVTRAAVEGRTAEPPQKAAWEPSWAGRQQKT